jgi:signal transduction histidine kinase/ActR/RegA family two-component response regulator
MFEALTQFLLDHSEALLQRWRDEARRDPTQPANRLGLAGAQLDDHLPALLRMLASDLRGVAPDHVEKEGAEHGHQRRSHGYTATEVLWEMTLFRRVLTAAVEGEFQTSAHRLSDEGLAAARLSLLDLLDRSVHASVSQYIREAEVERDEARAQVADTTARFQDANTQLKDAQLQKDRFLSVLSHELRNPLAATLTSVHLLKRLGSPDPKTELYHAIIERQTRYLSRLVDDLLDLNRIAYGKLELRPEAVFLQGPVTLGIESSQGAFAEKGVDLVLDLAEHPIVVFADSTRVSQVVMNLLANALKFTPAGGRVTVSLQAVEREAVICVRDTGAGIPAELLPRVFEPFEQADMSLAHGSGGLGIGLMIARGLIESQGGKIEAHSDGAERGAEFVVRLPLSLSDPSTPNSLRPDRDSVSPRRIVLIEDNEDARGALATALRFFGHEVFVGSTAEEALELARTEAPDTFVLDIGLPGTDGYSLAKALRATSEGQNATLIALTGYGTERDRDRARDAGFSHHLTKPLDVDTLIKLLGDAPAPTKA